MAFVDVVFPARIALGSSGGPTWKTNVIRVDSGHEKRNQSWSQDLGQWETGSHLRNGDDVDEFLEFFNVVGGMANTFRWKDRFDSKASGVTLGTGDGSTADFQLVKPYTVGSSTYTKTIVLPIEGTVRIAVDGTLKTEDTHYTVAYTTGLITFTMGNIPTMGQVVTVPYFEFHKRARLDADDLSISYADLHQGTVRIGIREVRG